MLTVIKRWWEWSERNIEPRIEEESVTLKKQNCPPEKFREAILSAKTNFV